MDGNQYHIVWQRSEAGLTMAEVQADLDALTEPTVSTETPAPRLSPIHASEDPLIPTFLE